MTPSAYGDSPQEVLGRVVIAAAWLAFYVWGWQSITHFSGLVSNGVLSLDWVDDGVKKLMAGLALAGGGARADLRVRRPRPRLLRRPRTAGDAGDEDRAAGDHRLPLRDRRA